MAFVHRYKYFWIKEIEVYSFVPSNLIPQMSDAADIAKHSKALNNGTVLGLVSSLKNYLIYRYLCF
jgi:hypothetical protein